MLHDRETFLTAKIDSQDIMKMVEEHLDTGAQMVFVENDFRNHTIYVTKDLVNLLGGYEALNHLVRDTFRTTDDLKDETRPYFFFGNNYKLGNHEGVSLNLAFPTRTNPFLEETQETFTQAIRINVSGASN